MAQPTLRRKARQAVKKNAAQLTAEIAKATERDRSTGRYVDTKFDKICECGHKLGQHTAVRSHGSQPCLEDGCYCEAFKVARRFARR